ncbi:DUF1178 family protein [Candidatus Pelagibacter sp.]|nr:DUF1178 family protein [Candidatus Pelagibacter sp.]
MIKYLLNCKSCSLEFESWFASSKEFDKLKKLNLLNCQQCNSQKIEKSLMRPNLANFGFKKDNVSKNNKNIKKKIREYQKFIKENFEYVGEKFAYEARCIHYNKNKKKKNIYGKASINDVKELKEEGIETSTIPWFEDKEN